MKADAFRRKRGDALVGSIEATYGIRLNARSDTKLGNLLAKRRFESLTQLVRAATGKQFAHPCARTVFLSFHQEDLAQVNGFRLMTKSRNLRLDISDDESRRPVDSVHSTYIKRALRARIRNADVLVCLIGNGTAWRDWVEWEIRTALEEHSGLCGIRLPGARSRAPQILYNVGAPIAAWNPAAMTAAIERAAALRS